LGTVLVTG